MADTGMACCETFSYHLRGLCAGQWAVSSVRLDFAALRLGVKRLSGRPVSGAAAVCAESVRKSGSLAAQRGTGKRLAVKPVAMLESWGTEERATTRLSSPSEVRDGNRASAADVASAKRCVAVSPDPARALTPWKSRRYMHDNERVVAGSLGRSHR